MKKIMTACLLLLNGMLPSWAQTNTYPNKPITMIVGFPAGGPTDLAARTLAHSFQKSFGQTIIVENKPGATGLIAAGIASRAPPDGYTVFVSSIGTFVVAPHLLKSVTVDPIKELDYISLPFQAHNVLVTGPKRPERSVAQVLELLRANPGKITFASSGVGASDHLAAELLWQQTNTQGLHVPYKGGAPAMQDLLGGQVDFFMTNINAVLPHIRSGRLHPIAITDNKRSPSLPDVPTFAETGVSGMEIYGWQALTAPKGLSPEVKKKLSDAAIGAMKDPENINKLESLGITIVGNSPEEFTAFVLKENERWKNLIRTRNIVVQ